MSDYFLLLSQLELTQRICSLLESEHYSGGATRLLEKRRASETGNDVLSASSDINVVRQTWKLKV